MRFFHTLIGSFYSGETYARVRYGQGHGFAYSLLLVTLATLAIVIYCLFAIHLWLFTPQQGKNPYFDQAVTQIADQLPAMTLTNDMLVTKEPGAHVIYLDMDVHGKNWHHAIATIDTSGATTYENMKTPVLINAKEMVVKDKDKKETKIHSFSELRGGRHSTMVISHAVAQDLASEIITLTHDQLFKFYAIAGVIISLGGIMVFYVLRLCMLVLLALGGMLLGQCLKTNVPFDMGMRVAAVAYTPVMLIQLLVLLYTGHSPATIWLLFGGLAMLGMVLHITRESGLADAA